MNSRFELDAAANCGAQAERSIRAAVRDGAPVNGWDNELLHAVRMTRLAVYHAFRARPDLRKPDNYDLAVAEARGRRKHASR